MDNWEILKKEIHEQTGFNSENYTDSFLMRRVECRMRALSKDDYASYLSVLKESDEEKKKLLKELTIHVTNFFRDRDMWDYFIKNIIPKFSGRDDVRIWSAGSSTGEEAYSIAMCFLSVFGKDAKVSIIGTDVDIETIKKAREGIYDKMQLREAPVTFISRYFEELEGNKYRIKDEVRDLVSFEVGDILNPSMTRKFDIVFCRNTVIYFEKSIKENFYVNVFNILNPGGYFIMGKTESLLGDARNMFETVSLTEHIFRKP